MHRFDHNRPDFKPYGFACELWKAAPMRRPDRHNEIELNLLKNGSLTYLLGGERVTIRQGSLGAFWAAIPHQIIGSSGNPEYYVVTLPLAWFLQCQLPANLVDRLLHGQFLRDPARERFELDIQLFQTWTRDLDKEQSEPGSAIRLELHARLQRLADNLPSKKQTGQDRFSSALLGKGGLRKAEQLAAYIAQHYQETIPIGDIARKVGLHPNYAMNLFKRTFNLTLNEYITQHRMSHAQRLLATTDDKIVEIALEAGYQTLSRFYEAFKKSCGCSPSRYRRDHR
ncbi:MAG: helix-turn-helix domain-containing protein [Pedosphaera sp.]|nr:helix-turn-helix domain-containing protein [Pedosphaera sp.]